MRRKGEGGGKVRRGRKIYDEFITWVGQQEGTRRGRNGLLRAAAA